MFNRLLSFINASNILANIRCMALGNHSTYMALLNLVDQISNKLDINNFVLSSLVCTLYNRLRNLFCS